MRYSDHIIRCLVLSVCGILAGGAAYGQQTTSEYTDDYEETYRPMAYDPEIVLDNSLFNISLRAEQDVFSRLSNFNFSVVRYRRRGYEAQDERYFLNGIDLGDGISGRPYYNVVSALQRVKANRYAVFGIDPVYNPGAPGRRVDTEIRPSKLPKGGAVAWAATDRNYLFATKANATGDFYSASLGYRWGRDVHVGGVFSQETVAALSLEKQFGAKSTLGAHRKHTLSLFALAAPSVRGLRSAATEECFSLSEDELYNPSWGEWEDGRQRNSRVRRSFQPLVNLLYSGELSAKYTLTASVACLFGESSQSALTWFDAQNPYPDYYRKLPSWFADEPSYYENESTKEQLKALWKSADPRVTGIDWQEMARQNLETDGKSIYMLEDRVERTNNYQFAASVEGSPGARVRVVYDLRARWDATEYFKRAKDLLGGEYVSNVDQYLIDDLYYGDKIENDVAHRGRRVYKGDKFGYDYTIRRTELGAGVRIGYNPGKFRLASSLGIGTVSLGRTGYYEKEMFEGERSLGRSRTLDFPVYDLSASAEYAFSPLHAVSASFASSRRAPLFRSVFVNPNYRNDLIDNPQAVSAMSFEANWHSTWRTVKLLVAGYYTATAGESEMRSYYDDVAALFCDINLRGISKLYYGIEVSGEVLLTPRLTLSAAFAAGSHTYDSNPVAAISGNADGAPKASGQTAYLKGYALGGSPQTVASGELSYRGARGWIANLSVNYMADNYIFINPVRRMNRIGLLASSPEVFAQLTTQERFPEAFVLNISGVKFFTLRDNHRLSVFASVNNLLDTRGIRYSGYEQMRLRRSGSGINATYVPFDSKYTNAYGRTVYCSVTYSF